MYYPSLVRYLVLFVSARAQVLDIPQVDQQVESALKSLSQYAAYDGPTESAAATLSIETSTVHAAAEDDASYWLADIAHQGTAAFNSNPSAYKVFRNVKDYGAAGNERQAPLISGKNRAEIIHRRRCNR